MAFIAVYVEGQTEESFVNQVLNPYLNRMQIYAIPILATTKRRKSGETFKGGITSYGQVKRDLMHIAQASHWSLITTMIDYYGLPNDFPGMGRKVATSQQQVLDLESAFKQDVDDWRFLPFITLHEYEGLLFSSPGSIAQNFPHINNLEISLTSETKGFHSPEDIDEGPTTHPAARILKYIPGYSKPLHGTVIAQHIGLEAIRKRCPHFSAWISRLEKVTS